MGALFFSPLFSFLGRKLGEVYFLKNSWAASLVNLFRPNGCFNTPKNCFWSVFLRKAKALENLGSKNMGTFSVIKRC